MPRLDPWPGEFPIEEWDPQFRQRVSDGKTYGNVQEEPVRQWAAAQLVKNFGVPHRQIKFEDPVKYQGKRKSVRQSAKGFRDIVVYDDRYNEESIELACRMFERILHLHVKMLEVRQLGGR
jgi:hypothetical protein